MATLFRIMLMYYVYCYTFFEELEKDWLAILEKEEYIPPERSLFDQGAYFLKKNPQCLFIGTADTYSVSYSFLADTNNFQYKMVLSL